MVKGQGQIVTKFSYSRVHHSILVILLPSYIVSQFHLRLRNSLPVQRVPDITYGLFRRQLKGQLFGKHSVNSDMRHLRKALTYLLTYLISSTRTDRHTHTHRLTDTQTEANNTRTSASLYELQMYGITYHLILLALHCCLLSAVH